MDLVRHAGRRSGRELTTPTQYARRGDDVIILGGRQETKTWWRNLVEDRDVELLMHGAEVIAPLLERQDDHLTGRAVPDRPGLWFSRFTGTSINDLAVTRW